MTSVAAQRCVYTSFSKKKTHKLKVKTKQKRFYFNYTWALEKTGTFYNKSLFQLMIK